MITPVWNLPPEKIARYRDTAIRRLNQHKSEINVRKNRAWELAHLAARLLRENYNAKRVVVFGSLIHEGCFNNWSDVDIAAWGIPSNLTLRAMGAVLELDKQQEINLVDINTCSPSLLTIIEQEGKDL